MKVLITGVAGFLGSHLAKVLLSRDYEVIGVDNLSSGKIENIANILSNPRFNFYNRDINDYYKLIGVFQGERIDYVYHYAAIVGVKRTEEQPLEVLKDIQGIDNIMYISYRSGVKKVIFSSSSEVYGHHEAFPSKEDGLTDVETPYQAVKMVGEQYCKAYAKKGMRTTALRFFNVYGERQESSDYGFVTSIFIRQALANEPITIFGDGKQTRAFTYVSDNVEMALSALDKRSDGKVINVGQGQRVTILQLARLIKQLTNSKSEIIHLPARQGEIQHRFPSTLLERQLLGSPKINLTEGLKRTIKYYDKR